MNEQSFDDALRMADFFYRSIGEELGHNELVTSRQDLHDQLNIVMSALSELYFKIGNAKYHEQ